MEKLKKTRKNGHKDTQKKKEKHSWKHKGKQGKRDIETLKRERKKFMET